VSEPAPGAESPRLGWIGLAISVVSLAGVIVWATQQDPPQLPSGPTELAALAGAVALYGVATLVRGERWWWILRHGDIEVRRADSYGLVVVGYMGNNVLPARGGDAIRTYLMSRVGKSSIRAVLGTLVAERVLDAVFLVTLFLVLAYGVLRGVDAPGGEELLLVAGGVLVLIAAVWGLVQLSRMHHRGRRVVEFLAPIVTATRELRGGYGAAMLALTALLWSIETIEVLLIGEATGLELSLLEAMYLVAVAGVFLLVPSGPGHLGALDAGVAFGVRAIGGSGSQAVSFLIALRFMLFVPITIAGLIVIIVRYGGLESLRAMRAGAAHP
jgi:glycosyltransferase 2 family protein